MKLLTIADIEAAGIKGDKKRNGSDASYHLYEKLVRLGWIDGLCRPLSWRYWQRGK